MYQISIEGIRDVIRECWNIYQSNDDDDDMSINMYQKRLHQLTLVYQETRRYLPSFLKLFKIMKEQKMMSEQDIINALKHSKELQSLETRVQQLIVEIQTLENKKNPLSIYLLC